MDADTPGTSVTPDARLPPLDDKQVEGLREVGREWARMPGRKLRARSLPVDPHLTQLLDETKPSAFAAIRTAVPGGEDEIESTPLAGAADSSLGRVLERLRRRLIGPPLRSTAIADQRMSRRVALSVLSPDALSSVAYGPEAMMAVLVLAGSAELKLSLPLGGLLVVLIFAVGRGYQQVIRAYPHGGGSYIVAKESLGAKWGLLAAAGLILDYVLTVAISVAAGVAAVTSALPGLTSATVALGLLVVAILVLVNLRGVKAAGALFAVPTYMFMGAIALIVAVGLIDAISRSGHVLAPPPHHASEALGLLLILRAFSSGATAMTGIEVISNAVPVFEPPQAENARRTLASMIVLLISMFAGVVLVAYLEGIAPGSETVLSQIARRTVGSGILYAWFQLATTAILLLAANSAISGFPQLLYFMARDRYVPETFLRMGDRLAFTTGIVVLTVPAAVIYAGFGGQTEPLIPLFAVGVFVAFTLAQAGMVAHWWNHRDPGWHRALAINLIGTVLSAEVVLVAAVTKFVQGAWLVVVLMPLMVLAFLRIHRHYGRAHDQLLPTPDARFVPADSGRAEKLDIPREFQHLLVVPVVRMNLAALRCLAYAATLGAPVLAVHVSPSEEEGERFRRYWCVWGDHVPVETILSPFRSTVAPLTHYVEALYRQRPDLTITVVVPQIVPPHRWESILHNRDAARLRRSLTHHAGIVVTSIPFHLAA
ncbi:MAG: APC family permease [Solirubrobacteraceae bacterium]